METTTRATLFATIAALWLAAPAAQAGIFNNPGNILIADQFNNRVIEVNRRGQIVWSFGRGPRDFTAKSIVGVNDAERVGRSTLMAGTGIPAGVDAFCKNPAGCPDGRVMLVDPNGKIVWQYGTFGVSGAGPNQLNAPVQATWTPSRTVFITDQGNQRVIEVNHAGNIRWQYGQTGVDGSGFNQLSDPNSAELLDNGNILIADEGNNRVIEVDRHKHIVKTLTAGGTANGVAFASRLANGDTLITDAGNNRIVEVDPNDNIVWVYITNLGPGSNANPEPTRAVQTLNGQIIISDQFNQRVLVVKKSTKQVIAQYGHINHAGYGTTSTREGLFAPYDAKVIGDFTGITPPY
jgi:hypothetical protein